MSNETRLRFERLALLRREHESAFPDIPDVGKSSATLEGELTEAGYELRLLPPAATGLSEHIGVWLSGSEGRTQAEVYGVPALYADGASEAEAVRRLADVIRLYARSIEEAPGEAVGPATMTTRFLARVGISGIGPA